MTVYTDENLGVLNEEADRKKMKAKVHIKVDTGMGRQGVTNTNAKNFIKYVSKLRGIKIEGIATHFATSDETKNTRHFKKQLENFKKLISFSGYERELS